jgi:hypothetical protein
VVESSSCFLGKSSESERQFGASRTNPSSRGRATLDQTLAAPSSLAFLHRQTLHPLVPFLIHVRLHVSAIVLPLAMQPLRRGDGGIFKYRPRITESKSSQSKRRNSITDSRLWSRKKRPQWSRGQPSPG